MPAPPRPNYGIDAPGPLTGLAGSGLACLALGLAVPAVRWMLYPATSLLGTSAVWLYSSLAGKMRVRDRMLDRLRLTDGEQVLDAGCGSGLLMIGAAKRLAGGTAVGVDIWRKEDLANNRRETTLENARAEGVLERVRVEDGDVRELPFGDASFDAVLSLNVLHNISERSGREQALREIARVLKPGGRLVLCDFRNTGEYARFLRENGLPDARRVIVAWVLALPVFGAAGTKPGS